MKQIIYFNAVILASVQFSRSVVSDSLWPHGLQHARPPCPSPAPGVYSNSCPLSQWCHPTISSSVVPFSRFQSFPASESFPMSLFFASGGQRIGVSASVLPRNIQSWSPLGLTVSSPCNPRGSQESSPAQQLESISSLVNFFDAFFIVELSHLYITTGKTIALTLWTFAGKVISAF